MAVAGVAIAAGFAVVGCAGYAVYSAITAFSFSIEGCGAACTAAVGLWKKFRG